MARRRLWIGILAAPIAWVSLELIGYYFAARSCEPGGGGIPMLGTGHPRATHAALSVIAAIIALLGLMTAAMNLRSLMREPKPASTEWGRARFMALVGVLTSALFLGGIILFGIPAFLVNACSQAR
jgi:hypothetical protein